MVPVRIYLIGRHKFTTNDPKNWKLIVNKFQQQ